MIKYAYIHCLICNIFIVAICVNYAFPAARYFWDIPPKSRTKSLETCRPNVTEWDFTNASQGKAVGDNALGNVCEIIRYHSEGLCMLTNEHAQQRVL
jgi:hypothetical protein